MTALPVALRMAEWTDQEHVYNTSTATPLVVMRGASLKILQLLRANGED